MKASDLKRNPVEEAIKEHIARGIPFSECMFRPGSEAFTEFYTRVRKMRESLDLDWQDQELLDTDIGECIMVEGERVPLDVPIEEEVELDEVTVANAAKAFDIKKQAVALKAKIAKLKNTPGDAAHMKMIDAKRSFDKKIAALQALDVDAYEIKKLKESSLDEAEYQGKKVDLNSPKRGGPKKFYVYVKNPKTGRVKKISWGDTSGLSVKAKNRGAVRSFVARHKCKQKNDKMKAGYWACRTPRYKALGVKGGQWW